MIVSEHARGKRFDLTIAARNLLTFTGYSGLDPEVNYAGQSGLSRGEFNTLPLSRTMIIRWTFSGDDAARRPGMPRDDKHIFPKLSARSGSAAASA